MSISNVLSQSVSDWVSQWQGHLLSCSGQLKTTPSLARGQMMEYCKISQMCFAFVILPLLLLSTDHLRSEMAMVIMAIRDFMVIILLLSSHHLRSEAAARLNRQQSEALHTAASPVINHTHMLDYTQTSRSHSVNFNNTIISVNSGEAAAGRERRYIFASLTVHIIESYCWNVTFGDTEGAAWEYWSSASSTRFFVDILQI